MKRYLLIALFFITFILNATNPPIYIAFHWHMHQPIYQPGQSVVDSYNSNLFSYNLYDVFNSRTGPYTNWPGNAINKMLSMSNAGAQISFSGSLVENLNTLESNDIGFNNWKSTWNTMAAKKTGLGNPRLDMVAFGYYHPLMPLTDYAEIRKQIQKHKAIFSSNFPGMPYSKGIFPPECAFENSIIPALVDEGIEWALVDNLHFDRACAGHPWAKGSSIVETNKADKLNINPNDWKAINGLWAPIPISAAWGHRPHWTKYIDPATGVEYKMIVVPASAVYGNEDGRGGFGALNYENTLSQLEAYNTDPAHPILVVLHHDGDNYGGGSDSYYGSNFDNFVNWLIANPARFQCTTIQDYLQRFPPDTNDIIHVESGSWYGAGADPEFLKWNGDPNNDYSHDRNSWSIMTATSNIVKTANQINSNSMDTKAAWDFLIMGQTSCYWYWDGTEDWDSKPTRASNLATTKAMNVVNTGVDQCGPSIYHPQREPYNPGETEWDVIKSSDFTIWTYVYDISQIHSVILKYRTDKDGVNSMANNQNETYTGGDEVNDWQVLDMSAKNIPSQLTLKANYQADEYSAIIVNIKGKLVDYYVEATDKFGNVSKSMILHTWVGMGSASNTTSLNVSPAGAYYEGGTSVTLTASGDYLPVYIYYTLDGTTPTINSTKVSSGSKIQISIDKTILKAFAVDNNGISSSVITNIYYTQKPNGITVRFQKPDNWSAVYFYAWTGISTTLLGAWPGTKINVGEDGWYAYTFDESNTSVNLVFNAGSNANQSVDLTDINSDNCFKTNGLLNNKYLIINVTCLTTKVLDIKNDNFKLFPNPVKDFLKIQNAETIKSIQVFDLCGNEIVFFECKKEYMLSNIQPGFYMLKINFENNKTYITKIIKQ